MHPVAFPPSSQVPSLYISRNTQVPLSHFVLHLCASQESSIACSNLGMKSCSLHAHQACVGKDHERDKLYIADPAYFLAARVFSWAFSAGLQLTA